MILQNIRNFFFNNLNLIWIYLIVCIAASVHLYLLPNNTFNSNYTHYNNYIIFKQSFWHLWTQKDLYCLHLDEQYDLFKYSPAFALFMAPFSFLPDWLGLPLWNLLNVSLFLYAVFTLPLINLKQKQLIVMLCFLECLTSIQSAQTNVLLAALFLLSFRFFEADKPYWASLLLMISVFIKLFGLIFFLLFLIYPQKIKFIIYSFIWGFILAIIPLLIISTEHLSFLYKSWLNMLQNDHSFSNGLSLMGWMKAWFGLEVNKIANLCIGFMILCTPFIIYTLKKTQIKRMLLLSSLLIWVIIFNHKSESPTFIIAILGVAIYAVMMPDSLIKKPLIILCVIFTSLSPTDLFPSVVRNLFVVPYVLKVVPCIFIWFHLNFELFKAARKLQLP